MDWDDPDYPFSAAYVRDRLLILLVVAVFVGALGWAGIDSASQLRAVTARAAASLVVLTWAVLALLGLGALYER